MNVRTLLLATLGSVLVGCGDAGPMTTSADCTSRIRADGVVYTSHGSSGLKAVQHATADRAQCDDVGPDGAGSVFPDRPEQVATWRFHGYPPEEVLGVRTDDRVEVYVADTVPAPAEQRIYTDLRWTTVEHDGVSVEIPADWERSEMDGCEFDFVHWAPPGAADCGFGAGVAFYASATFDPARGPGAWRDESSSRWLGYTLAGEYAVNVSAAEHDVVRRVLASAGKNG